MDRSWNMNGMNWYLSDRDQGMPISNRQADETGDICLAPQVAGWTIKMVKPVFLRKAFDCLWRACWWRQSSISIKALRLHLGDKVMPQRPFGNSIVTSGIFVSPPILLLCPYLSEMVCHSSGTGYLLYKDKGNERFSHPSHHRANEIPQNSVNAYLSKDDCGLKSQNECTILSNMENSFIFHDWLSVCRLYWR